MKRIFLQMLGISCIGLASTTCFGQGFFSAHHPYVPPKPIIFDQTVNLASFHAVKIITNVDININANSSSSGIKITGPRTALRCLRPSVVDGTLNIGRYGNCRDTAATIQTGKLDNIYYQGDGAVTIQNEQSSELAVTKIGHGDLTINGNSIGLSNLMLRGSGTVNINNINTPNLSLDVMYDGNVDLQGTMAISYLRYFGAGALRIDNATSTNLTLLTGGSGDLEIHGYLNIAQIFYNGSGNLQLYWINTPALSVFGEGAGRIQLAGIADNFHAEMLGEAHMDARFLRSHIGFITTTHEAQADVWVTRDLYALAQDHSNIYYFTPPHFLNRHSAQSGSVLAMHDVPGALLYFMPGLFN